MATVAALGVAALAGTAALTGCGLPETLAGGKPRSPEEAIRVFPGDGAREVGARDRLEVRVPDGRLERVVVGRSGDGGSVTVPGRISRDGLSWRPRADRLVPAARYTVDAVALDGHGRRSARHTTFTTSVPMRRFIGFFTPENGSTVGTGMIVSFDFSRPVADRAAVERAISVTARPGVPVAAHWFGARRLDFRPRDRWRPGTEVTVALRLRDVRAAPGVYGIQRKRVRFRIGRDQTSTVDAAAHTMTVRRAGRVLATLPVTAGDLASPTYNGKMVILERHAVTRMNGDTVGFGAEYDIPDVPHALRLTTSGTFLHGNYWAAPRTFGAANTSHGCIGLRDVPGGGPDTPAGWFFDRSLIGDTVEVVRSPERTVAPDNGLGGWNMPWRRWLAGSALR
ncbi:Ig-like domain-containing protein [Streptomyces sp. MST-110588]|uniref:L,D-transpeptidase n=1 Tax=Streptomyces sp. MST-110588 TaxID=2833628 RepID=UPI001F5D5267|nr:Ig-like domain-containing protein [Streptomyces sp. MST-110588]UNO43821.1 L,D-transpeptidase family protein [Streptomyces sp. MST-110588]